MAPQREFRHIGGLSSSSSAQIIERDHHRQNHDRRRSKSNSDIRQELSQHSTSSFPTVDAAMTPTTDNNNDDDDAKMKTILCLEEQLIQMKIELATAKSREDYLIMECRRLKIQNQEWERENRELKMLQLKLQLEQKQGQGSQASSSQPSAPSTQSSAATSKSSSFFKNLFRGVSVDNQNRRASVNTNNTEDAVKNHDMATYEAAHVVEEKYNHEIHESSLTHPPSCVGFAYADKSNPVSCLSLFSAASNEESHRLRSESSSLQDDHYNSTKSYDPCFEKKDEEYENNKSQSYGEYTEPLHAQKASGTNKNGKIGLYNSTSCASGIAFMRGSLSMLSINEDYPLEEDTKNDDGDRDDNNGVDETKKDGNRNRSNSTIDDDAVGDYVHDLMVFEGEDEEEDGLFI